MTIVKELGTGGEQEKEPAIHTPHRLKKAMAWQDLKCHAQSHS